MHGIKCDHKIITAAGWTYRTNDRGWTIYCDPYTRRWHTRGEALTIIGSPSRTGVPKLIRRQEF